MQTVDNYPMGAANDPRAPYNEDLDMHVRAEVSVTLGLFVDVEVSNERNIKQAVKDAISKRFKSDDVEINNILICQYDILSE